MKSFGFVVKDQNDDTIPEDQLTDVIDRGNHCACFELNFTSKSERNLTKIGFSTCCYT